jgi:hypothetical protein
VKSLQAVQPAPDVLARLRELELRLNSLSGSTGPDVRRFREDLVAHEDRRGKRLGQAVRQASSFALEITRGVDAKLAPRLSGVADRALLQISDVPISQPLLGSRAERQLLEIEALLPDAIGQFATLRSSGHSLEGRLAIAGERLDDLWRKQDPQGIGGWRLVMRAVSSQVELEKDLQPAFIEQYRGEPESHELHAAAVGLECPRCKTPTVRRIKRETMLEEILRIAFVAPYRCATCGERSYQFRYTVRKAD